MISYDDETIKAILDTAERFADRELIEKVHDRDKYPYCGFAEDVFNRAGEAGLLYITAPEDLGGVDLPAEIWALVLEKIASADSGIAASLLAHALAAEAVLKWGGQGVRSEWLGTDPPRVLGYPLYLQADDPQGLPSAQKQTDGYLLSGTAKMVANAPAAHTVVIAAEVDGDFAFFLVPLSDEARPEPIEVLGLRSCPIGHLDLPDVIVPADHFLARGKALSELHELFYPAAAAILIAGLKASLDYAIEYGMERYQGGRMIHEHSQLRSMYGRMAIEHRVAREAWLRTVSGDGDPEARLAVKVMASDLAVRGVMDGVQLLGGYGYTMEYPQERRMRDARQAAEILGSPSRLRLSLIDEMIGQ